MARPAKGTIMERPTKGGRINRTLRFYAGGRRHTKPLGAVSRDEAEPRAAGRHGRRRARDMAGAHAARAHGR